MGKMRDASNGKIFIPAMIANSPYDIANDIIIIMKSLERAHEIPFLETSPSEVIEVLSKRY